MKELERLHSLLNRPSNNAVVNLTEENTLQSSSQSLFIIANTTRNTIFRYATINAAGNINFHCMSPFKFVDQSNSEPNYQDKTMYVSVSMDAKPNKNKPGEYANNNLGNFITILQKNMISASSERPVPNIYNAIDLLNPLLKFGYIPSSLTVDFNKLNAPFILLYKSIEILKASKDEVSKEDYESHMTTAYQTYCKGIIDLFSQGLLTFAHYFINPTPNSVSFSTRLEKTMQSQSQPWFNINSVTNIKDIPLGVIPIPNDFQCVVNLLDNNTLGLLYSDNDRMLGERIISKGNDIRDDVKSLTVLATINDYNKDTPILLTINDNFGTKKGDRSRVDIFNSYLDKGVSQLLVKGTISPTVRLVNTDASRNGVVIVELRINSFTPHVSASVKTVLEADSFSNLDLELDSDDNLAVGVISFDDNGIDTEDKGDDSSVSAFV